MIARWQGVSFAVSSVAKYSVSMFKYSNSKNLSGLHCRGRHYHIIFIFVLTESYDPLH